MFQQTIALTVAFAICAKWWQEGIASFLGRILEHKPKGLGKKTHCYDKHYFLSAARPLRVTCHLLGQSSGRLLQRDAKGRQNELRSVNSFLSRHEGCNSCLSLLSISLPVTFLISCLVCEMSENGEKCRQGM